MNSHNILAISSRCWQITCENYFGVTIGVTIGCACFTGTSTQTQTDDENDDDKEKGDDNPVSG